MRTIAFILAGAALSAALPVMAQEGQDAPPLRIERDPPPIDSAPPMVELRRETFSQDGADEIPDFEGFLTERMAREALGPSFVADTLTPEQETRLPAARRVVAVVLPQGAFRNAFGASLAPTMDQFAREEVAAPVQALLDVTSRFDIDVRDLNDDAVSEAMELFDPAYDERVKALSSLMSGLVTDLMEIIEPEYRRGMERAYAARFSEAELAEIEAFVATPFGGKFARESYQATMDPQVMEAMNALAPAMVEVFPQFMENMIEKLDGLPEQRTVDQLLPAERARLAELLGIDEGAIDDAADPADVEPDSVTS